MSTFSDICCTLDSLSCITAHQKRLLVQAGYTTLGSLLANVPVEYENREETKSIQQAQHTKKALVYVEVLAHNFILLKRKGRLLVITVADESGKAELHCYGRDFLQNTLSTGIKVYIWGSFSVQFNKIVSSSFEVIADPSASSTSTKPQRLGFVPRYKTPTGFSQITYSKLIKKLLRNISIPELHNYAESSTSTKLIDRDQAIRNIHEPSSLEALSAAQQRLAFDEVLVFQLFLKINSTSANTVHRTPRAQHTLLSKQLVTQLPFSLTRGQLSVIHKIQKALWSEHPMTSLLQGDVGSGKTLVTLFCALAVIEAQEQVAFAVPSETLAHQHFTRIEALFSPLGVSCALLTGSTKKSRRTELLAQLVERKIDIIVGTHALYSKDVVYSKLGFIIIDEQHRFGVMQRAALVEKGIAKGLHCPDVLLMSATPIPRSLALTIYGNMDILSLKERPAIQQTVQTRLVNFSRRQEIYKRISEQLKKKSQAFIIFPQIEFTEENTDKNAKSSSIVSVEALFPEVSQALAPFNCKMLHSKIADDEKLAIMQQFEQGKIDALVATTIIEVGIDVPNATSIVIFNAERFGLATLHQLRGRVGRGRLPGEAILVFTQPLSETAKERLKIIYEHSDGFVIAEKDMELRGPGDIHQLGYRQSGALLFQFAETLHSIDYHMLQQSLAISNTIVSTDPNLCTEQHTRLRSILFARNST